MRPFQFIRELKSISTIESISDLIKINDFIYGLVPWTMELFNDKFCKKLDNHGALNWLYVLLKEEKIGGWCGLSVDVLQRICRGYGIDYKSFNYGIENYTHIVGILTFKGSKYLFDPYFNKYYASEKGILTFDNLMDLIQKDKFSDIQVVYGSSKKALIREETVYVSGYDFEKEVVGSFVTKGMNEVLLKNYGNSNPYNLMKTVIGGLDGS